MCRAAKAAYLRHPGDARLDRVARRVMRVDLPEQARARQAEAELSVARANVATHKAAVERARAELDNSRAALVAATAQTEKAHAVLINARRDVRSKLKTHSPAWHSLDHPAS